VSETSAAIPTFRALKYYPDGVGEHVTTSNPRDDVLIRFMTQRTSVTPPKPLPGDCLAQVAPYLADPLVMTELHDGAVMRDGCYVFTERNELLRESVDRLASVTELSTSHPDLGADLAAIRPEPSPEAVAILGSQRTPNYFHWWIDILARWWVIRDSPYRGCHLVTPPLGQGFQRESLHLLGLSVTSLTRPLQRFRQVVFSRGLTSGSAQAISPQVVEFAQWCRTTLELSPTPSQRKLFLSRSAARSRGLVDEDEVLTALGAEFERVELEALSVREQAMLFSEASIVVAPHGAGLTNLLFCTQPTAVVELVHEDAPPEIYRRLAGLLGHPYIAVGCEPVARAGLKPGRRDMRASVAAVSEAVAHLQGLSEAAGRPASSSPRRGSK
jgi:Glycosyltransferase 61